MLGLKSAEPTPKMPSANSSQPMECENGMQPIPTPTKMAPMRVSDCAPKRRVSGPITPPWMTTDTTPTKP